jgi:hypothetical protein
LLDIHLPTRHGGSILRGARASRPAAARQDASASVPSRAKAQASSSVNAWPSS